MGEFNIDIGRIIIWFVVFLLSLSIHECFHALAAELSGDSTGRYMGRITLNPIAHIDPFGTILLPLLSLTAGGMMFGWAKPVPFDPSRLRDKRKGEIFIAIAGPLGNVLLVIVFMILFWVRANVPMISSLITGYGLDEPVFMTLLIGIQLNVVLAVFNMIPIPPLDGHHVLRNLLPDSLAEQYSNINPMIGMLILFGLIYMGFTSMLIAPIIRLIYSVLGIPTYI